MSRRSTWQMTVLSGLLAGSLLLSGCGTDNTAAEQPQLVKVMQAGTSGQAAAGTYAGTVRGRYESNLAFQAGGRITSRNVQAGSSVRQGDILMTVNPQDVVQAVNQAQAQASAAQAQLELARTNLSRYQALYEQNAVSAASLDQYQTAYDQAAAQYNQAMAAVQAQQNQLSYTSLTADADGVVSSVSAEVGQVVAAGTPVLTLVHAGEMEAEVHIPENRIQDFSVGKPVTVSFWALQNQRTSGVVREVSPVADTVSRTYTVRISLPEPPQGLQLGMTASVMNVSAASGQDSLCTLPLAAIYQIDDTPKVWVVRADNTVTLKPVTVLAFGDNTVQVSGLDGSDVVVTAGVHMLHEGEAVRTESEDA